MARGTREITGRIMVMEKEIRGSVLEKMQLSFLFFSALLLCVATSAQVFAVEVPLIRFDSEPAAEASPGRSAAPGQQKHHPAPAIGATQVARSSSSTATIRGAVFYNDRRTDGLFAARRDKDGNPGQQCDSTGKRDDGSACTLNWLAGKYMVVDVIERDEGFLPPTSIARKRIS